MHRFSLVVIWRSLRVWRVLYSCVTVREGSPLLLHDLFYGNTFLCCLQQHRDQERGRLFSSGELGML